MPTRRSFLSSLAAGPAVLGAGSAPATVSSRRSGPWSAASTWASGRMPGAGSKVEILPGHTVIYDRQSDEPIRMIHITGTLVFARDRSTCLNVGLIKIGGDSTEDGFNCVHQHPSGPRPALEVGTADDPIPAAHTALIRLKYFEGLDRDSFPSIVCCGGRMGFHGAPLNRTWLKIGAPANKGETWIKLAEPVTGWRARDRVILTATVRQNKIAKTFKTSVRDNTQTEEFLIKAVEGDWITVDRPLAYDHICDGPYRADVANLSRNVIVESADPGGVRGHTMYHHGSAGAVSYAEFRHLGKRGVLGRYTMHFHQVRDSMRGASVIGASIWDSANRWITVHGTDYLVIRDCVGYHSLGHGFFLEDGTEVYNVLDRNLAVQACVAERLPNQVLPFDHNDGAGFWWGNSLNTFTRNVACECDEYGYRFDIQKTADFDPVLEVPLPNGSSRKVDVRTLSFVRFEDNEAHCMRRHAFNLGGMDRDQGKGCDGVGPDVHHPFVIRNMRVWNAHWAFHTFAPSVMIDGYDMHHCEYAMWRQNYDRHAYRGVHMDDISVKAEFMPKGTPPKEVDYPKPLEPVDDLPPLIVVTYAGKPVRGKMVVRGTASDRGVVKRITVNGAEARALRPNFAEWEVTINQTNDRIAVRGEDAAGNVTS